MNGKILSRQLLGSGERQSARGFKAARRGVPGNGLGNGKAAEVVRTAPAYDRQSGGVG